MHRNRPKARVYRRADGKAPSFPEPRGCDAAVSREAAKPKESREFQSRREAQLSFSRLLLSLRGFA
jgi:hypothetical protein